MKALHTYWQMLRRTLRLAFAGDWSYHLWIGILVVICLIGLNAYAEQFVHGLAVTDMSDHVSWGVYIANFTFLVGVADAAVMLVIPVYIYKNKELHDLVIFGQLLASVAIIMCLLFVVVDIGQPLKSWHLIPFIGKFNFPGSMLSWDVVVLNGYLILSVYICAYLIYCRYVGKPTSQWFNVPFVLLSIFWAISIHTVTAFLYVGLGGKPFWNSAIVGPRFIASAFVSGPAIVIIALQIIRHVTGYKIADKPLLTLRSLIQVSMLVNLFLLANELFKEFYTDSLHVASAKYLYFGLHGHFGLVGWIWTAIVFNLIATVLLVSPASKKLMWLNVACVLAIIGIWIEKGMGLVIPGFIPTPLGEVVDYLPTLNETLVCLGIWAFGLLLYTLMLRTTVPVLKGDITQANAPTMKNPSSKRPHSGRTMEPENT